MRLDGRICLLALGLALMGCDIEEGSGRIESERRTIPAVSRVEVGSGFEVEIELGAAPELLITTDDNLLDDIQVEVDDGVLEIEWRDDASWYDPTEPVRIQLTLPRLTSFDGSGGTKLRAPEIASPHLELELSGGSSAQLGEVWVDDLEVELSGGSRVECELLSAKRFELESSGGSKFEATGLVPHVAARVSGGGKLLALDLVTDRTQLRLSGGSRAELTVTDRLSIEASGGSQLLLGGDPRVDSDLNGGSRIERAR